MLSEHTINTSPERPEDDNNPLPWLPHPLQAMQQTIPMMEIITNSFFI
jgi:hypothetical protein